MKVNRLIYDIKDMRKLRNSPHAQLTRIKQEIESGIIVGVCGAGILLIMIASWIAALIK